MGWMDLYSRLVPSRGGGARRRPDLRGAAVVLVEVAAAAVADEAEVAAVVEARRLPDLRRAAAVLVDEAAAFADEAEAAAGADEAAALAEVALVEAEAVALAEVADGAVTPFARPRWDKFVRQFFMDRLVLDLRGIFLSWDQPIAPTPKPNTPKSRFALSHSYNQTLP
ncbi:hypothetical protein OsJ_18463 [Oryza sativa Japonica Group]|uniref:Uncharacterized protein n=1 Tax=Oryza sativa subsp. japonica TaxID=39947 RepID=B9FIC0_ORYSJ|nr:hypothetical protein OsJ_18463 [Oryza sativa Japonica Group]